MIALGLLQVEPLLLYELLLIARDVIMEFDCLALTERLSVKTIFSKDIESTEVARLPTGPYS